MDEIAKQVHEFIRQYFYYLEYPNRVAEGFWKNEEGKLLSIMSMNKEEIRESVRRVKTDLYRFEGVVLPEIQQKALAILFPMAQSLLHALKEELEYREEEESEARQKNIVEFQKELEREKQNVSKAAPKGPKQRSVTLRLPLWIFDRISAAQGNFEDAAAAYLEKGLGADDAAEAEVQAAAEKGPVPSPPSEIVVQRSSDSPVVRNSVDSILRFTRLALSYDFPKETIVNYIRLIEKTAQRLEREIRKKD